MFLLLDSTPLACAINNGLPIWGCIYPFLKSVKDLVIFSKTLKTEVDQINVDGKNPGTDLHRVDPGLGAADALHCGDRGSVELTEGQQAGVGRVMADGTSKGDLRQVLAD